MSTTIALRSPTLEWAHQSAQGELEGLSWVDPSMESDERGMTVVDRGTGKQFFRQSPYLRMVPTSVAEAAQEAAKDGRITAWEAASLMFARAEWLVSSRRYLWAPFSPVPRLLASLVEGFGVEPSIHKNDPERLARLTALLPAWHPHRGTLDRAREVLACCELNESLEATSSMTSGGEAAGQDVDLADEVFVCHDAKWWMLRQEGESTPHYRISDGIMRYQPPEGDRFALRKEDVLIRWTQGQMVPREVLRLLPAWTVVRLSMPTGRNS